MSDVRIICTGSRSWTDRHAITQRLMVLPHEAIIVVGYDPKKQTPKGADEIVFTEADLVGFAVEAHPARWDKHHKAAGAIRNKEMADLGATLCLAFWDGLSTGTFDMMGKAVKRGIPVEVIHP